MGGDIKQQNFLRRYKNTAQITPAATWQTDIEEIKNQFGRDLNTLIIFNRAAEEVAVILDGFTVGTCAPNDGVFSIDWRDGIIFNFPVFKNDNAVTNIEIGELIVTIGRTAPQEGQRAV